MRISNYLNNLRQYLSRGRQSRRPQKSPKRLEFDRLEDRLVPSTATLSGTTLNVNASPGIFTLRSELVRQILLEADATNHAKLDVYDGNTLLGQFPFASIQSVNVNVAGVDNITFDNSNGLPFAGSGTVTVQGSGGFNSLTVKGSQPAFGSEFYSAGDSNNLGSLGGTGPGYFFSSAVGVVEDLLPDSGTLTVEAKGQSASINFTGSSSLDELTGLANGGGGGALLFAGKRFVELSDLGGTINLNATAADPALQSLGIQMNGTLNINATPTTVFTTVLTSSGEHNRVNLLANSGPVNIIGDPTSIVDVGSNSSSFSESVTSGINADVSVSQSGFLWIADAGNTTTQENMRITESTISGSGMFGNSKVVFTYRDTIPLIFTGRLANTYIVAPSSSEAHFNDRIVIDDAFSNAGMTVLVEVDSFSGLDLHLINANPAAGQLIVLAPGAHFNPASPTTPNGTETMSFSGGLTSDVVYQGFDSIDL
jgi:hypothetical protein